MPITATPVRQLETLFVTDAQQRIVSTREPHSSTGPAFFFIRGETACAWAVGADVSEPVAVELNRLAAEETPSAAWEQPLRHAERYAELLSGRIRSGPAFAFPDDLEEGGQVVVVEEETELKAPISLGGSSARSKADGRLYLRFATAAIL